MTADDGASAFPPPEGGRQGPSGPPVAPPPVDAAEVASPAHRRAVLAAGVVGAVLTVAVIVFVVVASHDDSSKSAKASSTLVRFDPSSDTVDVIGSDGAVERSFDAPPGSDGNVFPGPGGRLIFDTEDSLAVADVADGTITTVDVPDGLDLDRRLLDDDHLLLDSAGGAGDDVVVVDLESGDTTSIRDEFGDDDSQYVFGRLFVDGATYLDLASDVSTSVVVPRGDDEMWTVDGIVADLRGERTLALSFSDGASTLSIADHGSERVSSTIDAALAGAILVDDHTALVITTDGDVQMIDVADGSSDTVTTLDGDVRSAYPLAEDRLFVWGEDDATSYLLDGSGEEVASFEAIDDEDGSPQGIRLALGGALPGSQCFVTQPGDGSIIDGGNVTLRDLRTGDVRAEFDASASLLDTQDGCTAVSVFDETADIALDGELRDFGDASYVTAVAPDLSAVVVNGEGGFRLIDVDSGDEVDLERGLYLYVAG